MANAYAAIAAELRAGAKKARAEADARSAVLVNPLALHASTLDDLATRLESGALGDLTYGPWKPLPR